MSVRKKNIGLIVFSRFNSVRFPGKALFKIEGRELLGHVLDRAKKIGSEFKVVVATSLQEDDDEIEKFAISENVEVYRGSKNNIIERALGCCKRFNFTAFARICGDRPLFCPNIAREIVLFHKKESMQLTTNIKIKTYPSGFTFEVIDVDTLIEVRKEKLHKEDLEHITNFFYRNSKNFKIYNFENSKNQSNLRCTIDYPEDLILLKKLVTRIKNRPILLDDITKEFEKDHELIKINGNHKPLEGYKKSLIEDKII